MVSFPSHANSNSMNSDSNDQGNEENAGDGAPQNPFQAAFGQSFHWKQGSSSPSQGDPTDPRNGGGNSGGGNGKGVLGKRKGWMPLGTAIGVILAVIAVVGAASSAWTEVLWFNQMNAERILFTRWGVMGGLFIIGFLLIFVVVFLAIQLAYRSRSDSGRGTASGNLRGYQEMIAPVRKLLFWGAPALIAVANASKLSSEWQTILMFLNGTPFGKTDPEFGLDISFFIFVLPALELATSILLTLLGWAFVANLVIHYLYGSISLSPRPHASRPARLQLGLIAAALSLVIAANYFLGRYDLLNKHGASVDGAMYKDVHAQMPAQTILAAITVLIAVLFVVAAFKGTWRLPAAGVVVLLVSGVVIGAVYPALIQQFQVTPNARQLEKDYIQRNIDATLAAYGMDGLDVQQYDAVTVAKPGQLREDSESTSQIRLLDPQVIPRTVQQRQQSRLYYNFKSGMSVDRYQIDGKRRDTVISMREINLDGLNQNQQSWVNRHTVFTHGFGVVAAYGNTVTSTGEPSYWEDSIPSKGEMGDYEPRIYFSPSAPEYSIVGAPKGAAPQELDYPDEKNSSGGQVRNTFAGDGGPSVGNFWNKLLYSIKFGSADIFFSNQTNSDSQILYDRDPRKRVAKVAPYLTLEQKAYPAVVHMDGDLSKPKRLVWIVDAYTTSDSYPYAQHQRLDEATVDSVSRHASEFKQRNDVNYMRNSVKAVVDAYDGSVRLFQWDDKDPMLQTWMKIYPDSVEPTSKISADLMSHLRYPEGLFKVQRELLTSYHVTDAEQFYTGGDLWRLAQETATYGQAQAKQQGNQDATTTASSQSTVQPPYYLTMKMPGQDSAEFSLTSVFVPGGGGSGNDAKREAMAGFLAVDSETGSEAGKVRPGYGKLRLMTLPSGKTVPGPAQVQNSYDSNQQIASKLNLLNQSDSTVIRGNLLTLPVGGGLLYVQPVYVQGTGSAAYPRLQFVLTAFGSGVGFAPTLQESLDQTFGGDSAATIAGEAETDQAQSGQSNGKSGDKKKSSPPVAVSAQERLNAALTDASKALLSSDKAMKSGDWSEYGKAQKQLEDALAKAIKAQGDLGQDVSGAKLPGDLSQSAPQSGARTVSGNSSGNGGNGANPSKPKQ